MYSSELCNESFIALKYEFTVDDFLAMEEYCDISFSIKEESILDHEREIKNSKKGK